MPVQGPTTPYPTSGPDDAAPPKGDVNLEGGAASSAAISSSKDVPAPVKPRDDFSTDAPAQKYERPSAPPGFDSAEFDKKMGLAEGVISQLGPAGQEALAQTVDQLKQNPELMADPQKFFAALEQTLQQQLDKHGVAIPPQGFDSLEQISDLVQAKHGNEGGAAASGKKPPGSEGGAAASGTGKTTGNEGSARSSGSEGSAASGSSSSTIFGQTVQSLPTTNFAILGSMPDGDIEALAFLVLMQAAKSAQEDVRAVMASVKAINATKAMLRQSLQARQKLAGQPEVAKLTAGQGAGVDGGALSDPNKGGGAVSGYKVNLSPDNKDGYTKMDGYYPTPDSKKALDNQIDQIKQDIDSMSEMGEMESLRLQMAMDRMSKMMSTLSNLLKKISDTASQITQNLK